MAEGPIDQGILLTDLCRLLVFLRADIIIPLECHEMVIIYLHCKLISISTSSSHFQLWLEAASSVSGNCRFQLKVHVAVYFKTT